MKLSRLLEGAELSHGDFLDDPDISRIVYDSRIIEAGDLFCCIPGLEYDGHDFVPEAIRAGASAVVSERALTLSLIHI